MFQLKNIPADSNSVDFSSNTTLPNNYGRVRTLKEDFANFESGKTKSETEDVQMPFTPAETLSAPSLEAEEQKNIPEPAVQMEPLPTMPRDIPPKEISAEQSSSAEQKPTASNPFGSETFFHTKSPFSEESIPAKTEPGKPENKRSGKLILIISLILLLIIIGGGVYYWWFFLKDQQKATPASTIPVTASDSGSGNDKTAGKPEEQALRRWKLDTESDKIAAKLAIEQYVQSFVSEPSSDNLIEAKIVSGDNQPLELEKFEELFSFQLPQSLAGSITNEYSLFAMKENSEPRVGAAFKLSASSAAIQTIQADEPSLPTNLSSFYFSKVASADSASFSSSKYKNADIRYFNFPANSTFSLDYTVIADNNSKYFVFSTSKNSLRAILDYMSQK